MADDKSKPPVEKAAYTLAEWCQRHSIARGTFYNLRKINKAPRVHHVMSKPLISVEADREWMLERLREAEEVR